MSWWVHWLLLTLLLVTSRPEVGNGPRNRLGILVDVETLVNGGRNGLDFSAQVTFNVVEVEPVIPVDQVDGQTKMAVTARATDTMKICLGILWEVKVDHHIDSLNVDTTREKIRADEVAANTVPKVVEDTVASVLLHLGVTVETRVAQLGDLLGQKLDTVGRVAENNGLVDLQL